MSIWYKGERKFYPDAEKNCNREFIEEKLKNYFPDAEIKITDIEVNKSGVFVNPLATQFPQYAKAFEIDNLPQFCNIRIERLLANGKPEHTVFWAPLEWNGRFCGTAGGGNQTGGLFQIMKQNDLNRGINLATAVINGFASANCDGGVANASKWGMDSEGNLDKVLIDEWAFGAAHWTALIGKALCEIIYGKKVEFSYLHGGSGGGRQSLMEAQRYPEDYDGIWASCPAVNWSKFFIGAVWPIAVMNSKGVKLTLAKLSAFENAVLEKYGGKEKYFSDIAYPHFDAMKLVGVQTEDGEITRTDCEIMNEIWNGARDEEGELLCRPFRPGIKFWCEGFGANSLNFIKQDDGEVEIVPFFVGKDYISWVLRDWDISFKDFTKDDFYDLFYKSVKEFSFVDAADTDLSEFFKRGGKLLIDHGTGDVLIPPDGTVDYYKKVVETNKKLAEKNCCLYFNAGDGHGNCFGDGAGITESDGMTALIKWVENGVYPKEFTGVRVDSKTGERTEKILRPYEYKAD